MKKLNIWIPVQPYPQQRPRSTIIFPKGMKKMIEVLPGMKKYLSDLTKYLRLAIPENEYQESTEIPVHDIERIISRANVYLLILNAGVIGGKPFVNVYDPKESEQYKKAIREAYVRLIKNNFHKGSWEPLRGALAVALDFYIEKPKSVTRKYPTVKPDLDNLIKPALDAGNGILWHDDSIFVRYDHIEKHYAGAEGAGIRIVVRPYGQGEFEAKQEALAFAS